MSDNDLTVGVTGTQWGKSNGGAIWMKRMTHQFISPRDNFIIGAPTYKILNQSTLPYFLSCMEGFGDHKKADAEFKIYNGGTVYFRTATDPDSIVGIPNVKAGWLDEAGKLPLYFYENYMARAASKGAKTLLTTSPYALNWLYKDIIKPKAQGRLEDVKLITAASWENPYHTMSDPVKREDVKAKMDPRRFSMIFGGEFGQAVGLVYDCFNEEIHVCEPMALPTGTKFYGGIDWGYSPDPFVIKVRAITPSGHHFSVAELCKTKMTPTMQVDAAKQLQNIFNIERFFADPSQPAYIEEFNRNGMPTVAAENARRIGIDRHYELIKSGMYRVFKNMCPLTTDEYSTYHYPEEKDLSPDQNARAKDNLPVEQSDHIMDAERYITISTYRSTIKHTPIVNEAPNINKAMTHDNRIKQLKKPRNRFPGSENFG